ncbi:MAG: glycosyltransferase family 4 protein [Acidimicrobiales bacterium]
MTSGGIVPGIADYKRRIASLSGHRPSPAAIERPRIVVNDYAGHPFQIELARSLAERGSSVKHLHCSTNVTPHGDLAKNETKHLEVAAIATGKAFDKYRLGPRLKGEVLYGIRSVRHHRRHRPEVVLSSNMPIISLLIVQLLHRRALHVLWLQDLQSGLAQLSDKRRLRLAGLVLGWFERLAIRRSDAVVAIAPSMVDELERMGIDRTRIDVIENWAPIDSLPALDRASRWSHDHDLDDKVVFLYSGTLGMKHDPALLVRLAEHFADDPEVRIVVASEGVAVDWVVDEVADRRITNVLVVPFQDFEVFPEMLAAADILTVILDPAAGSFSIPSKVLSYLCAARPILGYLPRSNSAATLIGTTACAGMVTDDEARFIEYADQLRNQAGLRERLGSNGRRHAEATFDIQVITSKFGAVFDRANRARVGVDTISLPTDDGIVIDLRSPIPSRSDAGTDEAEYRSTFSADAR